MVATWAISFLSLTVLESFLISSTTTSTALSMPLLRAIGLAPAVTFFIPSRKMFSARTVAVVVPSPATSEVFSATSFTSWAPIFSKGSFSSISLATVTPSLVMVGEPNFFSITTFLPLGPKVTFTALANVSTPLRIFLLPSSSNINCLAIFLLLFCCDYLIIARISSSFIMRYSWPSLPLISVPAYLL